MQIWAKKWCQHKITAQFTDVVQVAAWDENTLYAALKPCCEQMDLALPVVVSKHINELNKFHRTLFYKNDFLESLSDMDYLEIEIFDENARPTQKAP